MIVSPVGGKSCQSPSSEFEIPLSSSFIYANNIPLVIFVDPIVNTPFNDALY
jgi:hypothetical protein